MKGLTRTVQELKGEARQPASYAAKVKDPGPSKPVIQAERKTRHAVIISPCEGSSIMSSKATKEMLMENLAKKKLNNSGLNKISNSRMVVETTKKKEMERVINTLTAARILRGLPMAPTRIFHYAMHIMMKYYSQQIRSGFYNHIYIFRGGGHR